MTLGFSHRFDQPFKSVWANDFSLACSQTFNANFGNICVPGDIVSLLDDPKVNIPKADVVIGGPPCQGFSLLNKKRSTDPRKQLWRPYLEVVKRSGASVFVMENVPQLLNSLEHKLIEEYALSMGFSMRWHQLLAADFGVAQTRKRAFIIGVKGEFPPIIFPPLKSHYNPNSAQQLPELTLIADPKPWRTVRDVIGDLPPPVGTEIRDEPGPLNIHFGRNPTEKSIKRYKAIPDEGMNRVDLLERAPDITPDCWKRKKSGGTDLFGRMWWDRPSFTIRTEFFKPEKGRYLHPEQHRPITHREAARLQSFPDDFIFCGSKTEIARQIGNAVPPLLAARVAETVVSILVEKN